MTVDELLEKLTELHLRGRGTWEVKVDSWKEWRNCDGGIADVVCEDEIKEVVID